MRTVLLEACWFLAAILVASCKSSPPSPSDAGAPTSTNDAASSSVVDAAQLHPILGEWERRTEPYAGMRIAIRELTPLRAVVTAPPPVTQERLSKQARSTPMPVARAQLECQHGLWKPGDELLTKAHRVDEDVFEATILVRDWGFTGTCRHSDAHAPARVFVGPDGELTIDVRRGKTVTQRWARVGP